MALRGREGGAEQQRRGRVRANPDDGGHAIRGFRAVVHAVGIDGGLFRLGLPGYAQYHPARGEPTGVTIRPVYCRELNDQSS